MPLTSSASLIVIDFPLLQSHCSEKNTYACWCWKMILKRSKLWNSSNCRKMHYFVFCCKLAFRIVLVFPLEYLFITLRNTNLDIDRYRYSECKVHEPERNDSLWYVHKYNTLIWKPVIRVPNKLYNKNQNFKVLGRLKLQDLFSNLTQCK